MLLTSVASNIYGVLDILVVEAQLSGFEDLPASSSEAMRKPPQFEQLIDFSD